jgi:hypothetical protein
LNGPEPHWPDERCALGLFHPTSVTVTHLRYPYTLVGGWLAEGLIEKIHLLKGACHSELTGHHVIAQSSCNTTFSRYLDVPDCYSESGKGDAAITSTALGAL